MNIIEINSNNIFLLNNFIKNKLPNTFRYFNTRDISCVQNHLVTIVGIVDNKEVAYGHLDYEDNIWLGICILSEYQGKGYGKQIMNYLLEYSRKNHINEIILSVDKDNVKAISLYKKYDFKVKKTTNTYCIMRLRF